MDQMVVNAVVRTESGKRAAKKLRANGRLPAVMYNSRGEAVMLDVDEAEFSKVWRNTTPTTLITLKVDGKDYLSFIKATEYDIITDKNLHVDFHTIDENKKLKVKMNVQFTGSPVGVREGGKLRTHEAQIQITCLPKDLPPRITADLSALKIGDTFRVKDLGLSDAVTVLTDAEKNLASVLAAK
ncbi:MAG TPA: 50S ribosomal protein L25 [Candidatus Treponema faecavium]|nr:50S ribosomal protein L25 [Candidatus Treponema faecavium]